MSFPPPPGLSKPPSSLPSRPPQPANTTASSGFKPAYAAPPSYSSPGTSGGYGGNAPGGAGYNAFTAFQPRSIAANNPTVSAPPTTTAGYGNYYQQQPQTSYQSGPSYYGQPQYDDAAYSSMGRNNYGRYDSGLDSETEAQIAQWQSAYVNTEGIPAAAAPSKPPGRTAAGPNAPSTANTPTSHSPTPVPGRPEQPKTVVRAGGGQKWTDSTLLEWDPAHFRLFVGNLAGEVTDDSLFKAFSQFTSVQKARVIRDKRTQKSKGYGFISFSDGDDYFKAAREMQGKYIGSHPVLLRRATTEVRPVSSNDKGKKNGGGGGSGRQGSGKVKQDGIKKPGKTKGGLKIIG